MQRPVPDRERGTGLGGLGGLQAGGRRKPFIIDPSLEHRQEREGGFKGSLQRLGE